MSIRSFATAGLAAIFLLPVMSPVSPAAGLTVGNFVTEFQSVGRQVVTDIEIDRATGDVFVVGTTATEVQAGNPISSIESSTPIGFIAKLDITGKKVWTRVLGRLGRGQTFEPRIARSPQGDLYAVVAENLLGSVRLVAQKWSSSGESSWTSVFSESIEAWYPNITFANNNLYVAYAGTPADGSGWGVSDAVVTRLNTTVGDVINQTIIGSSGTDVPTAITVTANGDIAVTGYTRGRMYGTRLATRTDEDNFIFAVPANLSFVRWGRQWGTPANDRPDDLVALSGGGFVVVGLTGGQPAGTTNRGSIDGALTKLTENGGVAWESLIGTAGSDRITDVEESLTAGNVLIGGVTTGVLFDVSAGDCDLIGATVNASTGALLNSKQFGTPGCDFTTAMKLRSDGSPVIGGTTSGSFDSIAAQGTDGFVLSSGVQLSNIFQFIGNLRTVPLTPLPNSSAIQIDASEKSDVLGAPVSEAVPLLCNQAVSPSVKWRREVATCAGLVVKAGTTTRIRLSLRNAKGVCSLSPRKRLKLTAPGLCKAKIRATQSNGSTKASWIVFKVS